VARACLWTLAPFPNAYLRRPVGVRPRNVVGRASPPPYSHVGCVLRTINGRPMASLIFFVLVVLRQEKGA
jgi:hypothetical protein